jgi:5-methylcytosine-specific restriction enzyme subunit McrC
MNEVFEQFVEHRLRDALRGHLEVRGQDRLHLDHRQLVRMRPDIVFRRGTRRVYVADAKYKLTADGLGKHSDYYQLLAYATAMGLPEGVLIYCHDSGEAPPVEVITLGNGKRLLSFRLALGGTRADIDRAITELAGEIERRAGQAASRPATVSN